MNSTFSKINERLKTSMEFCKQRARARRQERMKGVVPAGGYVYLIQSGQYVKIGIATNVASRLANLQTGSPIPLKLLASWSCADPGMEEDRLHEFFNRFHVRGEWFEVPADILSVVAGLKDITELLYDAP